MNIPGQLIALPGKLRLIIVKTEKNESARPTLEFFGVYTSAHQTYFAESAKSYTTRGELEPISMIEGLKKAQSIVRGEELDPEWRGRYEAYLDTGKGPEPCEISDVANKLSASEKIMFGILLAGTA